MISIAVAIMAAYACPIATATETYLSGWNVDFSLDKSIVPADGGLTKARITCHVYGPSGEHRGGNVQFFTSPSSPNIHFDNPTATLGSGGIAFTDTWSDTPFTDPITVYVKVMLPTSQPNTWEYFYSNGPQITFTEPFGGVERFVMLPASSDFGPRVADGQTAHQFQVSVTDANQTIPQGAVVSLSANPATGVVITPSSYIVSQTWQPVSVTCTMAGMTTITATATWNGEVYSLERRLEFIPPLIMHELWPFSYQAVSADGVSEHSLLTAICDLDYYVPAGATVILSSQPSDGVTITPSRIEDYQTDTWVGVTSTVPGSKTIAMTTLWGGKTYTYSLPIVFTTSAGPTCDLAVDHACLMADGLSRVKVSAVVREADGSPVAGATVSFGVAGVGTSDSDWQQTTDTLGRASIYVNSDLLGEATFDAVAEWTSNNQNRRVSVPTRRPKVSFIEPVYPQIIEYFTPVLNTYFDRGNDGGDLKYELQENSYSPASTLDSQDKPHTALTSAQAVIHGESWQGSSFAITASEYHTFVVKREVKWYRQNDPEYDPQPVTINTPVAGWTFQSGITTHAGAVADNRWNDAPCGGGGWASTIITSPMYLADPSDAYIFTPSVLMPFGNLPKVVQQCFCKLG